MAKKKKQAEKKSTGKSKRPRPPAPPSGDKVDEAIDRLPGSEEHASEAELPEHEAVDFSMPDKSSLGFPVVGVGASAGGLEAIEELLSHMPADTGMAFVIVTHQFPGHVSILPELLRRKSSMPVMEATDGLRLKPNHVYVGTPGSYLAVLHGTLQRMDTHSAQSPKLPIDYFLRSLAEDQQQNAVCIILSGTGTDGTLGLRAIKGNLGTTMVEQPQAARFAGMPSSAIATGLADFVLTPAEMPQALLTYFKSPNIPASKITVESATISGEPLQKIFLLLRNRTGNDFSSYKVTTLRRRIERRMNLQQINGLNEYVRYLQENPHEIDILFKELLISVTSFFRDPSAWEVFSHWIDEMVRSRPENYTLRAWVPGCSTGEEVFSLGIELRESIERFKQRFHVQIFGSDLDATAIEKARSGLYPEGIAADVVAAKLERYFIHSENSYRVRKEIRELATFAPHNVIKDPPFTKLDIITCRNLLIYLNSDLQKQLLPLFHYALKPGGLLFLGSSESIGNFVDLFEPLDKHWKIFRRKESIGSTQVLPKMPAHSTSSINMNATPAKSVPTIRQVHRTSVLEQALLSRFVPASVVVNELGDIVYIHGRTGAYLEPSQGQPRNNVLGMAREGLQIELAAAMRQCVAKENEVVVKKVPVKSDGMVLDVDLTVSQLREPESVRGLLLITFQLASSTPEKRRKKTPLRTTESDNSRLATLERELQHMRDSHQATLEELETANEELTSTNEELQSTNEELQSTNEELETSKEEMQSLNEELTTVNSELQAKIENLSQINDDMQNLLNGTNIATIFLDNELNIKRFTEQAKQLAMIRPTDIGRPISDLALKLEPDELVADCRKVLKSLVFKEAAVHTKDGVSYLMRILPYRTAENVIDGLVLTFVDINRLRMAEAAARKSEVAAQHIPGLVENISQKTSHPLMVLDEKLRIVVVNEAFCRQFQMTREETEGELIYELEDRHWDNPKLKELLEHILPKNSTVNGFELEFDFPHSGRQVYWLSARQLAQDLPLPGLIVLSFELAEQPERGVQ